MDRGDDLNFKTLDAEFSSKADGADRYLREVEAKVKSNRSYERVYDETLAEFYVYNFLRGRTWLASRSQLLSALSARALETPSEKVFDRERFETRFQGLIRSLVQRFNDNDEK